MVKPEINPPTAIAVTHCTHCKTMVIPEINPPQSHFKIGPGALLMLLFFCFSFLLEEGSSCRRQAGFKRLKCKIETQKGSHERLFILTRTHSMQIFGEIPFIKPQNDT